MALQYRLENCPTDFPRSLSFRDFRGFSEKSGIRVPSYREESGNIMLRQIVRLYAQFEVPFYRKTECPADFLDLF